MYSKFKKANVIFLIFLVLMIVTAKLNIDQNLSTFISEYFTIILVIFLASLSCLIFEFIQFIQQQKQSSFKFSNENKELVNKLKKLTYEEKNVLALFVNDKVQEKSLNTNDQAVAWLESVKFIINTGKIDGNKKVFRIDPTLSKHLVQNPNTLY